MTDYSKITALYSRLSVGDEDRDGGESNSIQNQKFENEVTQLAEPTEQEIRQMREEIEEAKKEKSRAYHRQYSREYRARNLEKQREYDRIKAREYRARRKAQTAAAQPAQ